MEDSFLDANAVVDALERGGVVHLDGTNTATVLIQRRCRHPHSASLAKMDERLKLESRKQAAYGGVVNLSQVEGT